MNFKYYLKMVDALKCGILGSIRRHQSSFGQSLKPVLGYCDEIIKSRTNC